MITRKKLLGPALGAGVILLLFLLAALEGNPRSVPPPVPETDFDVGIPTAREVKALAEGYGTRIGELESRTAVLQEAIEKALTRWQQEAEERSREILSREDAPPEERTQPPAPDPSRLNVFDFPVQEGDLPSLRLPAGSFGEGTLLTGVYAPIEDEALPVLIRIDAALIGPSRTRFPLSDAFLVGKARGDANSERAVIQLQTISFVDSAGRAVERPVNGWVVDRDGLQGLAGTYVWQASKTAGLAVLTGGLAGGAEALAERERTVLTSPAGATTLLTGNAGRFAGSRAASAALSKLSDIMERRLEEIVPAIHVPNGKPVTVAFISGVTLPLEEPTHETGPSPHAGLDLDH